MDLQAHNLTVSKFDQEALASVEGEAERLLKDTRALFGGRQSGHMNAYAFNEPDPSILNDPVRGGEWWTPKDRFSEIPFYVYGNKLAIILFEPDNVSISIIDNPKIAEAYKKQFNVMWDQAIVIPKDQQEAQGKHEPS